MWVLRPGRTERGDGARSPGGLHPARGGGPQDERGSMTDDAPSMRRAWRPLRECCGRHARRLAWHRSEPVCTGGRWRVKASANTAAQIRQAQNRDLALFGADEALGDKIAHYLIDALA